jgi:hypothetical protein
MRMHVSPRIAHSIRVACLLCAAPVAAHGQTDLDAEQLKALVTGRTWAIAFYGDLTDKTRTSYWDFLPDGRVCARLANNPPGSSCADDGKWRLEENKLCWELGWFGKTDGFQVACGRARRSGDAYQFINVKNDGTLMAFRPQK